MGIYIKGDNYYGYDTSQRDDRITTGIGGADGGEMPDDLAVGGHDLRLLRDAH
jgi:hypothetical protein